MITAFVLSLSGKRFPNATNRQCPWVSAKDICDLKLNSSIPQLIDTNVEVAFRNSHDVYNLSIWLGLRKKIINENDCVEITVDNDAKLTDYTLDKCYSVNCIQITEKEMRTDCRELQHPLCVKTRNSMLVKMITTRQFKKIS